MRSSTETTAIATRPSGTTAGARVNASARALEVGGWVAATAIGRQGIGELLRAFAAMPAGRQLRLIPAALALAALTLPLHRALAFDPEAWVVWGREAWSLSI